MDAVPPIIRTWTPRRIRSQKLHMYMVGAFGQSTYESFGSSVGNARAAVLSRVTLATPPVDEAETMNLAKWAEKIGRKLGGRLGQPLTDGELLSWIESLPAKKRRRYHAAYESLLEDPFKPEDAKVKCFVKSELTLRNPAKFYKPRMIQFRTARYLVHVARYLKPIEHAIYGVRNVFTKASGPECAKSMHSRRRGEVLAKQARQLRLAYFLSLDCSAFDAHIGQHLLRVEQLCYKNMAAVAGWSRFDIGTFTRAMKMQLVNRVSGVFPDGSIKYVVKGNRMSGDLNTSCGNCIVFMLMISYSMDKLVGRGAWTMLDDGDDCVVMMEETAFSDDFAKKLQGMFESFGVVLRIDGHSTAVILENVDFCQCRPVLVEGKYKMVRNWSKVLSTVAAGTRWHSEPELFRSFCSAVGIGDGIANVGVPVLQSWFGWVRKVANGAKPDAQVIGETHRFKNTNFDLSWEPVEITLETRLSFQRAFGLDVLDQVKLEESFEGIPYAL